MSPITIVLMLIVGILLITVLILIYEGVKKYIRRNDVAGDNNMATDRPDMGRVYHPYSIRDVEITKDHCN